VSVCVCLFVVWCVCVCVCVTTQLLLHAILTGLAMIAYT